MSAKRHLFSFSLCCVFVLCDEQASSSSGASTMSCKPPQSSAPPFGVWENLPAQVGHQTTYGAAYMHFNITDPAVAIRPKEQHPWTSDAKFDTRSTAQDAFQGFSGSGARQSYKPLREYEPIAWPQKITTTNQAMFIPFYAPAKREPFRPKLRERDTSRFDTRSTAQDSYLPIPSSYRPRPSIYPVERPYEAAKFDYTSTSRAAYIPHPVQPDVAAKKPKPSMGADGTMA
jgi:hypothetical protein